MLNVLQSLGYTDCHPHPLPQARFIGMKVRASSSVQVQGMLLRIKMSERAGRENPCRRIGILTQGPTLQPLYDNCPHALFATSHVPRNRFYFLHLFTFSLRFISFFAT